MPAPEISYRCYEKWGQEVEAFLDVCVRFEGLLTQQPGSGVLTSQIPPPGLDCDILQVVEGLRRKANASTLLSPKAEEPRNHKPPHPFGIPNWCGQQEIWESEGLGINMKSSNGVLGLFRFAKIPFFHAGQPSRRILKLESLPAPSPPGVSREHFSPLSAGPGEPDLEYAAHPLLRLSPPSAPRLRARSLLHTGHFKGRGAVQEGTASPRGSEDPRLS